MPPAMTGPSPTTLLRRAAEREGFAAVGVCPAVSPAGLSRFDQWLAAGYAGEMDYLPRRRDAYAHPWHVHDGARSLVALAYPYSTSTPRVSAAGQGRISRYAWGDDYHELLWGKLDRLAEQLASHVRGCRSRGVVDTAPLLEREVAALAGLGWIGKNTLLLNRSLGSWFFLAVLLTDAELEYDAPAEVDHCGSCRACLDACPTGAFAAPYVLDARRCISYLTIELRSPIPRELRPLVGDWLYGCDVCQEVCPWNNHAPTSLDAALAPRPDADPVDLASLFSLDDAAFKRRFRRTPVWRAKRRGLLRNAAIVLANRPAPDSAAALIRGLTDAEPLVRGACAYALGRCATEAAIAALVERRRIEDDAEVLGEISAALQDSAETAAAARSSAASFSR